LSLRRATILIIAIVCLFILAATFFLNYNVMFKSYVLIEEDEAKTDTKRFVSILNDNISTLADNAADWAKWDDSYQFIDDLNADFVNTNMVPDVFDNLKLDAMLFINTAGQVVFSREYNAEDGLLTAASASLITSISASDLLKYPYQQDGDDGVVGLLQVNDNLAVVSSYAILPSSWDDAPRGALVMLRYFDDDDVKKLNEVTLSNVTLQTLDVSTLPSDFADVLPLLKTDTLYTDMGNSTHIRVYTLLEGLDGRPAGILRLEKERVLYQQLQKEMWTRMAFTITLVAVGATVALLILFLRVLNPIYHLRDELHRISATGDYRARISLKGFDEIAQLAKDINVVTAKIQQQAEKETKLRQQLETDLKQRAEFTRELVHELKSPITPILSSSELLVEGLKEEPWVSLANNVYRGALDMNDRLDDLIDLAKGEIGTLSLRREPLDFNLLVRQMAEEMMPLITSRAQQLRIDLPSSLPAVQGDEIRLRQILRNLISNATKFTPEKGTITVKVRQNRGNIVVNVTDTGRGISPEKLAVLFDEKEKNPEVHDKQSGLGLGLKLAKTLIELHGGKISVESVVNKGSTFTFTLPLV